MEEIKDFTLSLSDVIIKRNKGINYESKDVPSTITENVKLRLEDKKKDVLQIVRLLDYTVEDFQFEKLGAVNDEVMYDIYFLRENTKINFI